jgi:hypothetical protein
MTVAILGGTLSAVVLAKKLVALGHKVYLIRNLNDPKRSISNLHVICEYQMATVIVQPDDPKDFKDEVKQWLDQGFAEHAVKFRSCTMTAQGEIKAKALPVGCQRIRPLGGFFALIDALMQQLPEEVKVEEHQIESVSRDGQSWTLHGRDGRHYGPFSAIIFAFDALPRASRKASQKQLLEKALPISASVIESAAYAQMSSSMAVCLHFDPPLCVDFDTIVYEDHPILKFVSRNAKDDQTYRGLREKYDTWTVVATPEWSFRQRPDAGCVSNPKANKSWDKRKVGAALVRAFGDALGQDLKRARLVVPTFHWEGCSYIAKVVSGPQCAFDASVGLGWCGDQFGGSGPAGAASSAVAISELVHQYNHGELVSSLPGKDQWALRQASPTDEDTLSITGPVTGRQERQDGLDDTWKLAVSLAAGEHVESADSYKKFRKNGPMGDNRPQGPWAGRCSADLKLTCEIICDGLMKLTGLSKEVQDLLLQSAFQSGSGVCGGLWDAKKQYIDMGQGEALPGMCPQNVSLADMALHGSHVLNWDSVGSKTYEVFEAIKASVPNPKILQNFEPDCVRVAFENMRGRTIRKGQTLCGWSRDNDRSSNHDCSPKVLLVLGKSKITRGFKYAKEDRASLDVPLLPGDVLVMYGDARQWVSAVNAYEYIQEADGPFDFVHMWFSDHRRLKLERPAIYNSIHCPRVPHPGDAEYKWMQFAYTLDAGRSAKRFLEVELHDSASWSKAQSLVNADESGPCPIAIQEDSKRRRWQSKRSVLISDAALGA